MTSVFSLGSLSAALSRDMMSSKMGSGLTNQYVNKSIVNSTSTGAISIPVSSSSNWSLVHLHLSMVGSNAGGSCSQEVMAEFLISPTGVLTISGATDIIAPYFSSVPYTIVYSLPTLTNGSSTSSPIITINLSVAVGAGNVDFTVWANAIQAQATPNSYNYLL